MNERQSCHLTKVMSPRADAVRLINHETSQLSTTLQPLHRVLKLAAVHDELGRDISHADLWRLGIETVKGKVALRLRHLGVDVYDGDLTDAENQLDLSMLSSASYSHPSP